ncbi:MAG TPA: cytochrome P450 [Candidatus Limnocylindrales bacterium]|nr:cytochrome P450 [Candidatus Limnocylindrales bacterium]
MSANAFTVEIDAALNDPAFVRDPYPVFRRLRDEDPVHWSPSWGMWLVTRYEDVAAVARDPLRFSNAGRVAGRMAGFSAGEQAELAPFRAHFGAGLIDSDPPDHARLRSLVVRAFTPRVVEAMRPRIAALVEELVGRHRPIGRLDAVRDLAYPLPSIVIAEILGLPAGDRAQFKHWADVISRFYGSHGEERLAAARAGQEAVFEARAWLAGLAAERRRQPADDLLSRLVAQQEGGGMTGDELLATCVTLMIAGHETTTSFIGVGLHSLLGEPAELARFRDQPEVRPSALEELLRYESPAQKNARVVLAETSLGGKSLHADELVLLLNGAANRDPAVFADPDRLILDRTDERHLAFGIGIHFCAGAGLARVEASVALPVLASLPGVRLADEAPHWQPNTNLRALESLPIAFEPHESGS